MYRLTDEAIEKGMDLILKENPKMLSACIDAIYNDLEGSKDVEEFHRKHMTTSCGILTIFDKQRMEAVLSAISQEIVGKVVVEIGAGVGLLALGMANIAREVYAIESDPAWSWAFTKMLYKFKQPNLTFIFGKAESMIGKLNADVAIIITRSGHKKMQAIGKKLANKVIDVYEANPRVYIQT